MWRLTSGQGLRQRAFGDESVLFNDRSGDTHLLGASACYLLDLLQAQPQGSSTETLFDSLAAAIGCARAPDFDSRAQAVLAQLAALHLIEALPC